MKKIINFLKSQNKKTKNFFLFGLGTYAVYALYEVRDTGYIKEQYGLTKFLIVVSGEMIGTIIVAIPVLTVSMILAIPFYYIFRGFAEENKKYLDYVAIIFVALSLIMIVSAFRTQ